MPDRTSSIRVIALAVTVALTFGATACSAPTASSPDGPGGSGVVGADPEQGAALVDADTACEISAQSATLAALGAEGTPADASLILALSYCQLLAPSLGNSSLSVEVVDARDVALTAESDPATFTGTLILLPELGEYGHFLSLRPGVDPASNPTIGALSAARDELGIVLSWSVEDGTVTFAEFEKIATELLGSLP